MSNFYEDYVIQSHPTGSNYICNPPVTDTDIDTVLLVKYGYGDALYDLGWITNPNDEIEYDTAGMFTSWRKGNKNYIVTTIPEFYKKFVVATKAAKALNLTNKTDRVALFNFMLYHTP